MNRGLNKSTMIINITKDSTAIKNHADVQEKEQIIEQHVEFKSSIIKPLRLLKH